MLWISQTKHKLFRGCQGDLEWIVMIGNVRDDGNQPKKRSNVSLEVYSLLVSLWLDEMRGIEMTSIVVYSGGSVYVFIEYRISRRAIMLMYFSFCHPLQSWTFLSWQQHCLCTKTFFRLMKFPPFFIFANMWPWVFFSSFYNWNCTHTTIRPLLGGSCTIRFVFGTPCPPTADLLLLP